MDVQIERLWRKVIQFDHTTPIFKRCLFSFSYLALLVAALLLAIIVLLCVVIPYIYRYVFHTILNGNTILQWLLFHQNQAAHTCPFHRRRCTSKCIKTICCQSLQYSVDNVSKMHSINILINAMRHKCTMWLIRLRSIIKQSNYFN